MTRRALLARRVVLMRALQDSHRDPETGGDLQLLECGEELRHVSETLAEIPEEPRRPPLAEKYRKRA